ncbi:hypothetical protein BS78_08G047100 [Paspalum vaginatum]|nr:hypothetical protein BS78_08G047100 [Paspalum vaginatum]KAJ1265033.1 hypothetical protein BS78_08G047100 [Paspalum vaginatum]
MQKAIVSTQVLGDEEDEEEDCKVCVEGEEEQMKAGMTDVPESCIKKDHSHITPELLLSLTQAVIKETNETLGIVVSSGTIDGNQEMEKGGETWKLLCHKKKHARHEVQVSVEGGEDPKKARMVEANETK